MPETTKPPANSIPDRIHVLHVDDEPDFADMTADFLEREDDRINAITATSASDGLDRLADEGIDCIVSDYQMPGMDGLEFLEAVREEHSDLPFLLFTGKGSEEVASDAIAAGATDYLQKGSGTEQYELLANRVLNAVAQYRATQRAAELDRIRTLASDVNQALVRAESRTEAETRVCEIITESDPYLFAWIGEVDPDTERITPRASAGIDEGYLDEVTDDDVLPEGGPGSTAIRERRVVVSQNVAEDPELEPWRDKALERGYRAVAAVPLEYQDTLYGELAVYADRPNAFDEDERELLAELGADIAHVFHSFAVHEQLRMERDRRQALFENAPSPVIAGEVHQEGAEHRIVDVNEAFEDVFGYERREVVGKDTADIVPETNRERHTEIRERTNAGEATIMEVERITADGPRTFLLTIVPFGGDEESADGWYAWYTDVSDRRERQRTIEKLHSTTNTLIEAETPEAVAEVTVDAVRDILDMPANGIHLYDESKGGLVPVSWTETTAELIGTPPTFAPGEGLAGTAFETGEPQIYDDISTVSDRYNPDTDVRSQIIYPLADHGVLIIGSPEAGAFDDIDVSLAETLAVDAITALNRIEREQQLQLMGDLVQEMNDGVVIVQNGTIKYTNPHVSELTGYSEAELVDRSMGEFIAPDYRETVHKRHRARMRGDSDDLPEKYEIEIVSKEGRRIPVEINVSRIEYKGQPATLSLVRDITDRKEHEQAVERERDRLSAIFETIPEPVVHVHYEQEQPIVKTVNPAFEETFGYDEAEIEGRSLNDAIVPEDQRDKARDIDQAAQTSLFVEREVERLTADGRRDFLFRASMLEHDEATDEGIGIYIDISERRDREQELARKNERLDEFASMISHDLRNPLNVAQGRLELAREECDSDHLDDASSAVDRSIALIDDLLTLAREGEDAGDVEPVDLANMCDGCWKTVETGNATLINEADQRIRADPGRLKQLLENLLRNAVEHGGEDVTVTIGDLDDGFYVADDGPGIPAEEREQVFDPGYSTAEEGTGLGLNIVRKIVEAHDWDITVTDSEQGGARFDITGVEFA